MNEALGSGPKRGVAFVVVVLILGAGVLALAVQGLRGRTAVKDAFPMAEGTLRTPGLVRPLTIDRDTRGLPHVRAETESDAFFGLGFVHAQDRLGQMLWLRRRARGRAAESLGTPAVEADRMARTLGFVQLAEAQYPHLDRDTRRVLEAYAAGVNARIDRIEAGEVAPSVLMIRADLPLEAWRAVDSLALFKLYAWGLDESVEASLVLSDLIQQVGASAAQRFFPEQAPPLSRLPGATASSRPGLPGLGGAGALRRAMGFAGPSIGSSAWVLGGAHTESGLPIVVADSHLPVSVPAWMHLDHIRGGGLDVAGSTLPGVPVFWSGHNRQVAWGAVHAGAVVTDLYIETLSSQGPSRYHDGKRWRPMRERPEVVRVSGGDDLEFTVRETAHGPLLPEMEGREPLSVAWTGARIDGPSGIHSLLGVARSGGAAALLAALETHHEPVLIFAYADSKGVAGTQVAGWIPQRSLSPQLLPLPGRAPWYEWTERVPFEMLPSARLSDGKGWLIAADEPGAEAPIDWLWRSGVRSARIEELLTEQVAEGGVELRAMTALQVDVRAAPSLRVAGAIEALATNGGADALGPQASELASLLADWDGHFDADSRGAAAYHVLMSRLATSLLADGVGAELWRRYVGVPQTDGEALLAGALIEAAAESKRGSRRVDAVGELVRTALQDAWLELSYRLGPNARRWTWGRLHPIRFRGFDVLKGGVELGPFAYGGGVHTVRAASFDPLDPFEVRVASTLRLAFDTGSLDQGLAVLAPGQSEHPGHRHFDDQLESWLDGRSTLLATSPLLVEETSVARLRLEPLR